MNIQSAESAVAISPATETKVDSGDSSKNVPSVREAIGDAKKRMFGDAKTEVQSNVEPEAVESKGEESVIEERSNEIKTQRDENRDRAREKDKKQISKLTAQKYALKEENARLQAELEKFAKKMQNEPQIEQFNGDDQAYNRAKIRYDMEMEQGVEKFQMAKQELEEKRNTEWTERCQSTVRDFNKFSDKYNKHFQWLSNNEPELMGFASQSIVGPRMVEEAFNDLFTSEETYAAWKGLSHQGRMQLLSNMESQMMREIHGGNQRNNAPIQKSNAPTPIAPEKSSEKIASKAVTLKDQIAKSKARMFA